MQRTGNIENRLDIREGFLNPPDVYGPMVFYWWGGEKLSKDRIAWQLDRLKENGFAGVNINYTHTLLGSTYKGDPPLFSEAWWKLWEEVVKECARRGMYIGFDDYLITHGQPRLATVGAEIHRKEPQIAGLLLRQKGEYIKGGQVFSFADLKCNSIVAATAYRVVEGRLDSETTIDLLSIIRTSMGKWQPPEGEWYISILYTEPQAFGAMNPLYAKEVIEHYFSKFEQHSAGEMGKTVNFFFQDELTFGGVMPYWSEDLPAEFQKQKGYDLLPELTALFMDIGPRTPKIRLDYYDVATKMMEKAYFKPIYEWCEQRNIIYGHDQCSRAEVVSAVKLYGDYFRTMRWYQAPGTDRMPELIRGKVCASIAQLYDRPRTWLEAYHSTGWGVTPQDLHRWDCEALLYGYNLLCYHSLYYTTRGGWWSWAPGDIHFRQPYWPQMKDHYTAMKRLCYLLSQGKHRCDVAVLFPTTTVQAEMNGTEPSATALEVEKAIEEVADYLFKGYSIDFDFIDDESIAYASIHNALLAVSGGEYRVLILPVMRTIRWSTLEKVLEFYRKGGVVIALGCLPQASDKIGANDPMLDQIIREIFGLAASESEICNLENMQLHRNAEGGIGCFLKKYEALTLGRFIRSSIQSDFICYNGLVCVMHRCIEDKDIYIIYNPKEEYLTAQMFFRVDGKYPQEWNAWNGTVKDICNFQTKNGGTELILSLEPYELKLIVFESKRVKADSDFPVKSSGSESRCTEYLSLDGLWNFTIQPTLDNRWGDFQSPAENRLVGPEARCFRYTETSHLSTEWCDPNFDDHNWAVVTASFGPRFWILGPVPKGTNTSDLEKQLSTIDQINPAQTVRIGDQELYWKPYEFSLRWGKQNDPLLTRQSGISIHGPIGWVPDEFIHLETKHSEDSWYLWTCVEVPSDQDTRVAIGTRAAFKIWLNGVLLISRDQPECEVRTGPWNLLMYPSPGIKTNSAKLRKRGNPLLLKLTGAGSDTMIRAFIVFGDDLQEVPPPELHQNPSCNTEYVSSGLVASRWYTRPKTAQLNLYGNDRPRFLWYRFSTPPGLMEMTIVAHKRPRVWVDGQELQVCEEKDIHSPAQAYEGANIYRAVATKPFIKAGIAAIRLETGSGFYGGAALPEPVRFKCTDGLAPIGDWAYLGLATYSGMARYTKQFVLDPRALKGRIWLSLGRVTAIAKIQVNGHHAGIIYKPPWKLDITPFVQPGDNYLEIAVANTLANHYSMGMPDSYRYIFKGQLQSGLFGPVVIEIN